MNVALIHNPNDLSAGAFQMNDLFSRSLMEHGVKVTHFSPKAPLITCGSDFKGIANILKFYSLIEQRNEILKCDLIQGTTFTPIGLIDLGIPTVSHFGSVTKGFMDRIPFDEKTSDASEKVWEILKEDGVILNTRVKTYKPMEDVASAEFVFAQHADVVLSTSQIVTDDLLKGGIEKDKIRFLPNAIEDFWFSSIEFSEKPALVYLGRIGTDPFSLRLKGLDRLIRIFQKFNLVQKYSFVMTYNEKIVEWLSTKIQNHSVSCGVKKNELPKKLRSLGGGIALQFSRYEGFGLGIVEAMACGLVPISFRVGIAPQLIENGVNGFLVDSESEMEECIALLLSDNSLRKSLSFAAAESVKQFNSKQMTKDLIRIYSEVLGK